jgi:hypothetical protein
VAAQLAASQEGLNSMELYSVILFFYLGGVAYAWLVHVTCPVDVTITIFWDVTPCSLVDYIFMGWWLIKPT